MPSIASQTFDGVLQELGVRMDVDPGRLDRSMSHGPAYQDEIFRFAVQPSTKRMA